MNDKIKCPDCDKTFDSPGQLGPHRNKAHGFRASDGKTDPARAQHGQIAPDRQPHRHVQTKLKGKFPCKQCDFVANWSGGLKKHMTAMHNSGDFPCEFCDKQFNNKEGLKKHIDRHHLEERKQRRELAKATKNADVPTLTVSNGHADVQTFDDLSHRIETATTIAVGRCQELLAAISYQFDVPPRTFTAHFVRTLGPATKVW